LDLSPDIDCGFWLFMWPHDVFLSGVADQPRACRKAGACCAIGRMLSVVRGMILATELRLHGNVARLFMGLMWWVLDTSKVSRRLMSSDHPLIMTNGLGRGDGHFEIPISPTCLFIAFMKEAFPEPFRSIPVGKIVRLVNEAVIAQGRRNVCAVGSGNLAEVRRGRGKRDSMSLIPS
jgi:hypothetical protein